MIINKRKLLNYIGMLVVLTSYVSGLHAQSATSKSDITSAIINNRRVAAVSNDDILSIAEGKRVSQANNDIIIISYNDVSTDVNRDISVWKGNSYPPVFYFPIDKHLLLRNYRNNATLLAALDKLINTKQIVEALDTIEIIGVCPPAGNKEYNVKLALNRCMALRSYLQLRWKHLQFMENFPIKFNIIGMDKIGYNILKEQKPPLTEKQIEDKLQYAAIRLKMKDGSYIIPGEDKQKTVLRADEQKTLVVTKPPVTKPPVTKSPIMETPVTKSPVIEQPISIRDTVYITNTQPTRTERVVKTPAPLYLALKTNLLYDAALLPNLTVEWYMGEQWSLAVEGNWSWWTFDHPIQNRWYHRIQTGGIELRRWFNSPYPLQGHALGIYTMIGNYDVRFFVQDEYTKGYLSYQSWSAGLSYAYSFPIARKLNLELGLAVGYIGGQYYKYDYCMTHEHWAQRSEHSRNYIGPTRVGISLVWLLGAGNDEKSRNNYTARQKQKREQFMVFENK